MRLHKLTLSLGCALALVTATGCSVSLDVPDGSDVDCVSDSECPRGFVCRSSIGRCVSIDGITEDGPTALTASVSPGIASSGVTVAIRFTTDVALGTNPQLSLRDPGGGAQPIPSDAFTLVGQRGNEYEYRYIPTGNEPEIAWNVSATLIDEFGTESENLRLGSLNLDFSAPTFLVPPAADPPIARRGIQTRLIVEAAEAVSVAPEDEPRMRLLWPDGSEATAFEDLNARTSDRRRFEFLYTPDGSESEEPAAVLLEWTDDAANTGSVQATGVVRFDFTPPSIVTIGPDIAPPPGNLLPAVRAASTGATVQVRVGSVEDLEAPPTMSLLNESGLLLAQAVGVEQLPGEFEIDLELTPGLVLADGDLTVLVSAADDLPGTQGGNVVVRDLGVVRFDSQPPADPADPSNVGDGDVVFRRTPWGSEGTQGAASFTVEAQPGTFEDDGFSWLIVFGGRELEGAFAARELGRAQVQPDGGVPAFEVDPFSRPFFVVADAAGNVSDSRSNPGIQAANMQNTQWTATLGGKFAGSIAENPHIVRVTPSLRQTLAQAEDITAEPSSPDALGRENSNVVAAQALRVWEQRSTSAALPPERNQHGAAFDSGRNRLVMFGGFDPLGRSAETWEFTGVFWERIEPASGVPAARQGHALAYDPLRGVVIMFGGSSATGNQNDTWSWNGSVWEELNSVGVSPSARQLHQMVYDATRGVIVLFGGRGGAGELSDTWEWNGLQWTQMSPGTVPVARESHAMAYDSASERVVMYGGVNTTPGEFVNDAIWSWDGTDWTSFTLAGERPRPGRLAMSYDHERQRLVAFGDFTWERNGGQWIRVLPSQEPAGREYGTLSFNPELGGVLLFGGGSGNDCAAGSCTQDTWLWDGTRWTNLVKVGQSDPESRDRTVLSYYSATGQTVMFGGSNGGVFYDDLWTWSGAGWSEETSPGPSPRFRSTMAYDPQRERLLLFGGIDPTDSCNPGDSPSHCGDLWTWDSSTGWAEAMPPAWTPSTAYSVGDMVRNDTPANAYIAVGGGTSNTSGGPTGSGSGIGDGTVTWNFAYDFPEARAAPAIAYDSDREKVLLYGGDGCSIGGCTVASCTDTWEWDPLTEEWTELLSVQNPPALSRAVMVYDESRERIVLFGGVVDANPGAGAPCASESASSETWEWGVHGAAICGNPTLPCWRFMSVSGSVPDGRSGHAMAYDSGRRRVVLFGGQAFDVETRYSDVWEWNGASWLAPDASANAPAERFGHGLVYDEAQEKLILFGGVGERDTWELGADPTQSPAVLFDFDVSDVRDIVGVQVHAVASGFGYTNEATGDGVVQNGVTLFGWDALAGSWSALGTSSGGVIDFATTDASQAVRLINANGRIVLGLRPTFGLGNGAALPQVDADYLELVVDTFRGN